MRQFVVVILLSILFIPRVLVANQLPGLERKISVQISSQSVEKILSEIGRQANVTFSYNPKLVGASEVASIDIDDETVRYALNILFGNRISCRERGDFLILQQAKKTKSKVIEGYLYDKGGEILANATVYSSLAAANTNQYGYFRIELDQSDTLQQLQVSKQGYEAAMLSPLEGRSSFVEFRLTSLESDTLSEQSDISLLTPMFLVPRNMQLAAQNIEDSFDRVAQFSLLPHIGTNSLLSGATSNKISINFIGGYVQSVDVLELGAFVNFVRYNAGVFQAAGFANYVGINARGVQAAGFVNHVGADFRGFQAATFVNNVGQNFRGFQAAAFANNVNHNFKGMQAAAFYNGTGKTLNGLQASAFFNKAKTVHGAQLSSFINIADTLRGTQISAFLNIARSVNGLQLGIVNLADTCSGVPLGILSFVAKGYHKLDVYASEAFQANVALRTGVRKLHNIYMFGIDVSSLANTPLYTFGLGLGTNFGKKPQLHYTIDAVAQQVAAGNYFGSLNMLYKNSYGIEWVMTDKVALFAAFSYNLYIVDSSTEEYQNHFSKIPPYILTNEILANNLVLNTWYGFKAGIRLF